MDVPQVLALPLEEALRRLRLAGIEPQVEYLVPPREEGKPLPQEARKFVVRQVMSDDKTVLTLVCRH